MTAGQIAARALPPLVPVLLFLALWQGLVWVFALPPFILPGPGLVAEALWERRALLADNAAVTALEVVAGLMLGAVLGAATALQLMISPAARRVLVPLLVFNQAVPIFALAPVLTLWMGYGLAPKIAITVLIVYFPVTWTFFDGLRRTDPGLLDLARMMGASEMRTLWLIRVPAALPALGSGLKLSAIYAPVGAVFGEWVGASQGLGYLMLRANGRGQIDDMFAAILILALFAVTLHALVSALARHLELWATGKRTGWHGLRHASRERDRARSARRSAASPGMRR
ncbi:MAG: ABC transporter permease [Pikeienuella sp.]